MDIGTAGRLELIHKNSRFQHKNMATGLTNIGNNFGGQTSSAFQSVDDDDDDVVFVEPVQVPQNTPHTEQRRGGAFTSSKKDLHRADPKSHSSSKELDSHKVTVSETIIIDDEEDLEPCIVQEKSASSFSDRLVDTSRPINVDFPSASSFSRSKTNAAINSTGITTEPDSEIQIANVTTLESGINSVNDGHLQNAEGRDMNLMITHVTSLQNPGLGDLQNGLHSNSFGVHMQTYPPPTAATQTKPGMGPYNPGRIISGDVFQNGESATHPNPDSWISQSASFPRNQKQPVVDSSSPVASLPKQVLQSPSQQPQPPPPKAVKVTCANCKKPLQKGQTAYQRKGSTHLFCSTTCLSSFSHKPAPKKLCTMCKKDITTMKGTIVAQVDSSESFQEFCSTYCLSVYEDKQNSSKNQSKSRCTICGKLTEIRHEVSFKNMTHKLCSDHCFNRYRMANGLIMNCCEQCGEYLPSKGAGNNVLMVEGQWKRFCSPACLNDFKLKHGKLTSCTGCKAQCRCFDMTQCIGTNGHMEPYCSTSCMNTHKAKSAKPPTQNAGIICHFCKKTSLPQYQATMPDGKLYNFCSSGCVAKFQSLSMQSTNGQHTSSDIQLKCNYCKNTFSSKPETLDWENKVHQFCSTTCCDDYKKLHCIVTYCEYCQEEKTLHEVMKFSGIKKPFCSEGCKLLYKQDFARRLGLKCVTCNYCFQMCKRGATKEFDGMVRDFCTDDCSKKFQDWYYKAARCDCCRTQGNLREKVQWRGAVKNFCDQQCLLRFYSQQNEPNMSTQKGPENMHYDQGVQTSRTRTLGSASSVPAALKDMKNKAVLCKPLSMTKATYCKPHMQGKFCQTEQELEENTNTKYIPVPIPVPVYIPAPMQLFSQNIPTAVPVPVPIPIFLPDSLLQKVHNKNAKDVEDLMETEQSLLATIDSVEASPLAMVEPVAESPLAMVEPVEESPLAMVEPVEESPLAMVEPVEESPLAMVEPVEESPLAMVEPVEESPLAMVEPVEESPLAMVEPVEESPLAMVEPVEESPLAMVEPVEESPLAMVEPVEESPLAMVEPVEESPLAMVEPVEESPLAMVEPVEESPLAMVEPVAESPLAMVDPVAESPLAMVDPVAESPLAMVDPVAESPLAMVDPVAESPLAMVDPVAESPLAMVDPVAESPLAMVDPVAESPLAMVDPVAESPLAMVDPVAESPLAMVDPVAESPLAMVDPVAESPLAMVDPVAESPLALVDPAAESPLALVDPAAESPLALVDPAAESPLALVDPAAESPLALVDPAAESPLALVDPAAESPLALVDPVAESPLALVDPVEESLLATVDTVVDSPLATVDTVVESPLATLEMVEESLLSTVEESPLLTIDTVEENPLFTAESEKSPLSIEEMMETSPISIEEVIIQSPVPSDEILEDSSSPLEEASEKSPSPSVELLGKSLLPAEHVLENSPLSSDTELENSPPKETILEDPPFRTTELLEESSLPTEELIDQRPFPLKDTVEKSPLSPSEPVTLTVIELIPEVKAVSESVSDEAVLLVSNVVPFKSGLAEEELVLPDKPYESELDIEVDFPRAAEDLDTENEFLLPLVFGEEYEDQPRPRPIKKGTKRKALLDYQSPDNGSENCESVFPFKYYYGLNAWKHWVRTQADDCDDLPEVEEPNCTKSVKLKEELLQHTRSELGCLLARFANEVRRPNGESYAPDSLYYLCLGIQEFLSSNRKDNIFADPDYQEFGDQFNKILKSWQPSILPDGSIFSRIEEDYLWQVNQLGMQTPMSLLFTLFYFNTKYFNLKTVDQHLRLSFGSVFRHLKNNPLTKETKSCLQYRVSSLCESDSEVKNSSSKRKREDDEPVFEQVENTADPSRCPVKIFEYYLSKSPQNMNQRMDLFYLKPERSASPESLKWYTSSSLDRNTLENMLIRVLLVKDIYDKNSYELDEDTD